MYYNEKDARREAALQRQEARNNRSDAEQLKLLESRGHGHCKEATKLRAKINNGGE